MMKYGDNMHMMNMTGMGGSMTQEPMGSTIMGNSSSR
jgi:hypothetical protein